MRLLHRYRPIVLGTVLMVPLCFSSAASRVSIDFGQFWAQAENTSARSLVSQKQEMHSLLGKTGELSIQQKLEQVNRYFAKWVTYQTDDVVWQQHDYWATPAEMLSKGEGDCEDYAIAKYLFLNEMGIDSAQLRLIYVKARIGGRRSSRTQAHMVLGYYASNNSEPLILDSLLDDILPASQRTDLTPVFSFNSEGIWSPGSTQSVGSPTARLSRWRNLLQKIGQEGLVLNDV